VLQLGIRRLSLPRHAVIDARLGDTELTPDDIENAGIVLLLFLLVIFLSWMAFLLFGHDPLDALFEVVSAAGTVGLSTGLCGAELEAPLKVVLCVDMLAGRIEVLALLVLLWPRTWIGRRAST
jgi:trk system potassium uptake protein TrkH